MSLKNSVILLSGKPSVGKTTVIQKVISLLDDDAGGFYSREICISEKRVGFEIVTLDGVVSRLATKTDKTVFLDEISYEGYKVNLDAINQTAVPSMLKAMAENKIIVIDEIGPMEVVSEVFCETVLKILSYDNVKILGTVVERPCKFPDIVKSHPKVDTLFVNLENRDTLPKRIYSLLMESGS